MTNKQENQLSMAKAVQQVLNNHIAIVSTIPAFQTAKTDLDAALNEIDVALPSQVGTTKGKAQDKEAAAGSAINAAVALLGPAKSYATAIGSNALFQAFNYSPSGLKKLRDTELLSTLALIKTNLDANVANLADYGITEANITTFGQLTDAYNALLTAPRNGITSKAAATASVAGKFEKLKPILLRLDGLAAAQKAANAVFYTAFKTARAIVDNKGKAKPKPAAA